MQRELPAAKRAAGAMLAVAIAMSAGDASADSSYDERGDRNRPASEESSEFGINAASVGLSLVYAPVKLAYSAMGLLFGGIAYGLSGGDSDVLKAVVTPAIHGDYVVLPKHIRRDREIEFFGRDPAYRQDDVVDSTIFDEIY